MLDESIRMQLLDAFFEANNGRMFCLGGFYGVNVEQAIRLAKHAEELGYDAAWGSAPAEMKREEAVLYTFQAEVFSEADWIHP